VLTEWESEKAAAKSEGRRLGWQQPKWKRDFQPQKLPVRPKKQEDESDGGDDDDDEHFDGNFREDD
jgi:hypothetical protein